MYRQGFRGFSHNRKAVQKPGRSAGASNDFRGSVCQVSPGAPHSSGFTGCWTNNGESNGKPIGKRKLDYIGVYRVDTGLIVQKSCMTFMYHNTTILRM